MSYLNTQSQLPANPNPRPKIRLQNPKKINPKEVKTKSSYLLILMTILIILLLVLSAFLLFGGKKTQPQITKPINVPNISPFPFPDQEIVINDPNLKEINNSLNSIKNRLNNQFNYKQKLTPPEVDLKVKF